jgi:hypothetical protein
MNQAIVNLRSALQCLSRDDLRELTVEEIERLECDLSAWAGIASVEAISKRFAAKDEAPE